ncbi:MAG: beta-glucanase (GH16 family) [Myxococcota bacterium]|jgi:beta-glucanase (GH16 family)
MLLLTLLGCTAEDVTAFDSSWQEVWSDEFDGSAGSPPDAANWTHDVGGDGWGNEQLEYNTDRTENAALSGDSTLVITAREEDYEGNAYTSARLKSQDLFEPEYGRIEARIKLPQGQGLWPAFWLLGADFEEVGWPVCGEIDILEMRGDSPEQVHGTIHGAGYYGGGGLGGTYALDEGTFADDFHTFTVDYEPERLAWYVDGVPYLTLSPGDLPGGSAWSHDGAVFLILNLAVGGNYLGNPDDSTAFPASLEVDWVKVWERAGGYPE